MLKELNRLWLEARRQAAAWQRWTRKRPHNRVRRPRIRNERGWVTGYGPPQPLPEPVLSPYFCQKVELPSGRTDVFLSGERVGQAYHLARFPKAGASEVAPLPVTDAEIRAWYAQYCRR
jgi:hypothetical protein